MNTNTNSLPNIESLQNLANDLFKALPNEFPKEISLDPREHPRAKAFAESTAQSFDQSDILKTQNQFAFTNETPNFSNPLSIGGLGLSPAGLSQGQNFGYENQTQGFDQRSIRQTNPPISLAGSGASPSYLKQGEHFNIENPETSFKDSNLKSDENFGLEEGIELPFQNTFFPDIEAVLSNIEIYKPAVAANPVKTEDFYFLEKKPNIQGFDPQIISSTPGYYFVAKDGRSSIPGSKSATGFGFDANVIKKDFPILNEKVNGKPLIWFDNAATTQKPKAVIDRLAYFYEHENSNIHRAAHEIASRATDAYESAREKVRAFLGAGSPNEIIFVRGATEAINLVAQSWGEQNLVAGDEIIVSNLEHHANIVPWKRLADKKGLKLRVIPVDDDGQILLEEYGKLLNSKTKLVAFTQVSNALGTVTPAQQMVSLAHSVGAKVLVDGAQSVSHMTVNVKALDADWFVFSGHKVFGPTGIGVLYGKEELLNQTQPWQGGGNMIQDVTFEEIKYHNAPNRFEAGTGNIADAVGLGAAIDYVSKIGMEAIGAYEHFLLEYATNLLKQISGVRLIGTAAHKASVLSFSLQGYTNEEVGKALNQEGIAVRTGHHCAQPILRRMGVETTVRPSLAFYNTCSDVDTFIEVISQLRAKKKY